MAHVMRMARAGEANTAERSSVTTGASRLNPGDVGPSNIPARSPSTNRRSSSATRRPSCASPAASVRTAAARAGSGPAWRSPGPGSVGSPTRPPRRERPARPRCARGARAPDRARRRPASTPAPSSPPNGFGHLAAGAVLRRRRRRARRRRSSGIEPDGPARPQPQRRRPARPGQRRRTLPWGPRSMLAGPTPPAAISKRLDEGRLPAADLAHDEEVGVGQHSLAIEVPGVEAERPAQQVPPDQRAWPAQAACADEGVDRLDVSRRGPVGGRGFHGSTTDQLTTTHGPTGAST